MALPVRRNRHKEAGLQGKAVARTVLPVRELPAAAGDSVIRSEERVHEPLRSLLREKLC